VIVHVAVFGLGEAGSRFAVDLVAAGVHVTAFDPAPVPTPAGVIRCTDPRGAVDGAEIVIALTSAADVAEVFESTVDALAPDGVFADLTTSPPAAKAARATTATARGRAFVDVALMAPVPGRGVRTLALASGPGAERYAAALRPFGASVEAIGDRAGDATTRKLLRSVTMKGLAAVVIEALRAAHAAGLAGWLWSDLVAEMTAADEQLIIRLVEGTGVHAARRVHEMQASASMLESLGVDPLMTRSTVESLLRVVSDGVPEVPVQSRRGEAAGVSRQGEAEAASTGGERRRRVRRASPFRAGGERQPG
jgi:3-hydroxyisobutyrate dehydrogenase